MSSMQENTIPEPTLLDWRGLKGPQAIVNTARAVKRLDGRPSVLRILADDDAFPTDLASWCRVTRSQLLQLEQDPTGVFAALVQVNGAHEVTRPVERGDWPGQYGYTNGSLDCRGMLCPEPILALARTLRGLQPGSAIEVLADDPAFPMDVRGWCRSTGADLATLDESGGVYRAVISARGRNEPRPADTAQDEDTIEPDTVLGGTMVPSWPAPRSTPLATAVPAAPRSTPHAVVVPAAPPAARATGQVESQPAWPADSGIRVDLGGLAPEELAGVLDSLSKVSVEGSQVTVTGVHKQFARHVVDWCARGGHALVRLETSASPMMAMVRLRQGVVLAGGPAVAAATSLVPALAAATSLVPAGSALATPPDRQGCAIVVLRSDMEAVLAALMTANTAASSGMPASILFAFWGINVLRGDQPRANVPREKVSLVQRVLKLMMPRGPRRQRLGKLSFAGAGGLLVRFLMKRRRLLLVEDLMEQACALNVRFLVCTMSMSVMGVTRRELMDLPNIELGGIAAFVADARDASINLVF
jgi:TusA-related sulfurtransferase/peroxiredoxin family protein